MKIRKFRSENPFTVDSANSSSVSHSDFMIINTPFSSSIGGIPTSNDISEGFISRAQRTAQDWELSSEV